jgi:hypothetical protein
LQMPLPIGLVYDALGSVALDPDQQIQDTVRMLFDTFREVRSASALVRRFAREGWKFPRRTRRGVGKGDLLWGTLDHSRAINILHNPRYAGAFVYGRHRMTYNAKVGSGKCHPMRLARKEWQVLIESAHPGYITWAVATRCRLESCPHDSGGDRPCHRANLGA